MSAEETRHVVLMVLSAPTGGGKTTIARHLVDSDERLRFSISHTTRPPRPREVSDRDYHFVSRSRFEAMAKKGEFLEWAEVHGHLYGTHRSEYERAENDGKDLVLDIDVQGGLQVRQAFPDATLVFILPPSLDVLLTRLEGRAREGGFDLAKRLSTALHELEYAGEYGYNVKNMDLADAVEDVRCILAAARRTPLGAVSLVEHLREEIATWLRSHHVPGQSKGRK
ncbi:MAG: guanylate kinase [Acidobacteriota bacterium]|jgi:guanylate kinase